MNIDFRGTHHFLPMLEEMTKVHTLIRVETFSFCAPAFRDILKAQEADLQITDLNGRSAPEILAGVDLCVTAGYPHKVKLPEGVFGINVHPTLLPIGRGPTPIARVIKDEPSAAGVTLHKLSPEFDAGDILGQREITLRHGTTSESYLFQAGLLARDIMSEILADFPRVWESARVQGPGTYWPKYTDKDLRIEPSETLGEVQRKFNALGTQCIYEINGETRKVAGVAGWLHSDAVPVGTCIFDSLNVMLIKLRDGYALIRWWP